VSTCVEVNWIVSALAPGSKMGWRDAYLQFAQGASAFTSAGLSAAAKGVTPSLQLMGVQALFATPGVQGLTTEGVTLVERL